MPFSLYIDEKLALHSRTHFDLNANRRDTSSSENSGLVMYLCVSSLSYCISLTFECVCCFDFKYLSAASLVLILFASYVHSH